MMMMNYPVKQIFCKLIGILYCLDLLTFVYMREWTYVIGVVVCDGDTELAMLDDFTFFPRK